MLPIPLLILIATFGHFVEAAGIDYDIEGNFYVVDSGRDMLVKYSAIGDSLRSVSGRGNGNLQFDHPVSVSARGVDIYVADYNNHRIQRFNRNLDYVSTYYLRDDPEEAHRFGYPRDVAVTRQGEVVVVDGENRRIVKLNTFGQYQRTIGAATAGATRLTNPEQIAVDSQDNLYVLDGERIVEFDPFGTYVRQLPFKEVRTLSIDRDTLVGLSDTRAFTCYLQSPDIPAVFETHSTLSSLRLAGGRLYGTARRQVEIFRKPDSLEIER